MKQKPFLTHKHKTQKGSRGFTPTPFLALLRGRGASAIIPASHDARKGCRGFTVVELLVSIGIFVVISGVILANYSGFTNITILNNLAHEIALVVRQAQVFGIGVQEFGVGSGVFPSHGVNFANTDNTTLRLFADTNSNGEYDDGELIELFTLRRGSTIQQVCGYLTSSATCTELSELNVTYTRPDPEATIVGIPNLAQYTYARITIVSSSGTTRDVLIWANGQISVE